MSRKLIAIVALLVALVGGSAIALTRQFSATPIVCGADENPKYSAFSRQKICMFKAVPDYAAQVDWLMAQPEIKTGSAELMGTDAHVAFEYVGLGGSPSGQAERQYMKVNVCNTGTQTVTGFNPTHLLLDADGTQAVFGYDYSYGPTRARPTLTGHYEQWTIEPGACIDLLVLPATRTRDVLMVYAGPNGVPISNQAILLNPMLNP